MARSSLSEVAVSSVVGTVLMLAITVSVFAGFSVVALRYFQAEDTAPRSDLTIIQGEDSLILEHQGGEGFGAQDGKLHVNRNNQELTIPLTDAGLAPYGKSLASLGLDDGWDVGDVVCVWGQDASCLFDPDQWTVLGAYYVTQDSLLAEGGLRASSTTTVSTSTMRPDLTVSLVSQSPTSAYIGGSTTWTVRVSNGGTAAMSASSVLVNVEVDSVLVGTATVAGPIPMGANSQATTMPVWTATTTGSKTLRLTVDPTSLVAETNDGNNQATSSFNVAAGVADPGQPYLDNDGDGLYGAGDTLIATSLVTDCSHSVSGNLVLPPSVGTLVGSTCSFTASGDLTLRTNIDSTGSVSLVADQDTITADGISITADGAITIGDTQNSAASVAISLVGSTVDNSGSGNALTITWKTGDLVATGATLRSGAAVTFQGVNNGQGADDVDLTNAIIDNSAASTGGITFTDIDGDITLTGATVTSSHAIAIVADVGITATNAIVTGTSSSVQLTAGGALSAAGAKVGSTSGAVTLSGVGITLDSGCVTTTNADVTLAAGTGALSVQGPSTVSGCAGLIVAGRITGSGASVTLTGATLTTSGTAQAISFAGTTACSGTVAGPISAGNAKITATGRICLLASGASGAITLNGACLGSSTTGNIGTPAIHVLATGHLSATGPATPTGCTTSARCASGGIVATTGSIHLTGTYATMTSACVQSTGTTTNGDVTIESTSATASGTGYSLNWQSGTFSAGRNLLATMTGSQSSTNQVNLASASFYDTASGSPSAIRLDVPSSGTLINWATGVPTTPVASPATDEADYLE